MHTVYLKLKNTLNKKRFLGIPNPFGNPFGNLKAYPERFPAPSWVSENTLWVSESPETNGFLGERIRKPLAVFSETLDYFRGPKGFLENRF